MKNSKPFYKKPQFWLLVILLALMATPSAIKIFELYIYSPQQEPVPEDFYIREEESPWNPQPLPKEEVDIFRNDGGQTEVVASNDGYTLTLDPSLDVSTWELEAGIVKVFKNDCFVSIAKSSSKTIEEEINKTKEYLENESGTTLVSYETEKIDDTELEAYLETYENIEFGVGYGIFIQGKDFVIEISQNDPYPECNLMMEILKALKFNE